MNRTKLLMVALLALASTRLHAQTAQFSNIAPPGGFRIDSLVGGTLSPSGISAGTYGSATQVMQCTFNANGIATSCSNVPVTTGTTGPAGPGAVGLLATTGLGSNNLVAGSGVSGATDNAAKLVAAMAALTTGQQINIPCGTYYFASKVTMPNHLVALVGEGTSGHNGNGCVNFTSDQPIDAILETATSTQYAGANLDGPRIEHISFQDTSSGGNQVRSGLKITDENNLILNDVNFQGFLGVSYSAGTISTTTGSNVMTCSGCTFTSDMAPGIMFSNDYPFEVVAYISPTQMQLAANWPITGLSGATYKLRYKGVGLWLAGGIGYYTAALTGSSGSTSVTVPNSTVAAALNVNDIFQSGSSNIPTGTTITAISGTTLTLSNALTGSLSSTNIVFLDPSAYDYTQYGTVDNIKASQTWMPIYLGSGPFDYMNSHEGTSRVAFNSGYINCGLQDSIGVWMGVYTDTTHYHVSENNCTFGAVIAGGHSNDIMNSKFENSGTISDGSTTYSGGSSSYLGTKGVLVMGVSATTGATATNQNNNNEVAFNYFAQYGNDVEVFAGNFPPQKTQVIANQHISTVGQTVADISNGTSTTIIFDSGYMQLGNSVSATVGSAVPSSLPCGGSTTNNVGSTYINTLGSIGNTQYMCTSQTASPTTTASSGSTTLTVSSAGSIAPGHTVVGTGIPTGAYVKTISGTTITISNATTAAVSGTVTFGPWEAIN